MSEIENHLKRALSESPQPADEAFVGQVMDRVIVNESMRLLRLAVLTVAALSLAGAFFHGLSLSLNAARDVSVAFSRMLSTAMPLFAIALAAVAFLVVLQRGQSRK